MARRIMEKSHNPQAFAFDGSPVIATFTISTLVANQARDVAADSLTLPLACKIPIVSFSVGLGGNNVTAMNVAIGGGVLTAAGVLVPDNTDMGFTPPQMNTTPGYCLFFSPTGPVDVPINLTGGGNYPPGVTFPTSEPDAIFPGGTVMTLRLTVGASTAGACRCSLLCIPVDINPNYTGGWTWGSANIG